MNIKSNRARTGGMMVVLPLLAQSLTPSPRRRLEIGGFTTALFKTARRRRDFGAFRCVYGRYQCAAAPRALLQARGRLRSLLLVAIGITRRAISARRVFLGLSGVGDYRGV